MADAVNIIGQNVANVAPKPRTPALTADSATKENPTAAASNAKPAEIPTPSARLYDDPLAGVIITQQLDGAGRVVVQTPPGSVVAYLRNGLTIDGYTKQSTSV